MRKSKKILNIAFIALCFSCLLFGVYAVSKNAKLTVNGTVGMFAHDCMVKASATIQGDGVFETVDGNGETVITPNISGHPSSERVLFTEEKIGFELAKTDVLKEIGTVYFTDLTESGEVETIIIKISLTNYSVYEIFVDAVNTEIENVVTGAYENGQETITNSYETTLMPNENIDIYFSFDLNKVGDDYQSFDSVVPFNIKLNFGKVVATILWQPKN